MSRTIVEIYLPWTFADEGTYRVSLDNTLATVWIKYFPSKGRLGEVIGLSAATNRLYPDDPFGIVNFSFIMIEIPFLLVAEVPLTILGSLILSLFSVKLGRNLDRTTPIGIFVTEDRQVNWPTIQIWRAMNEWELLGNYIRIYTEAIRNNEFYRLKKALLVIVSQILLLLG